MKKNFSIALLLCLFAGLAFAAKPGQTANAYPDMAVTSDFSNKMMVAEGQKAPSSGNQVSAPSGIAQDDATLSGLESEYKDTKASKEVKNMKDPLKPWNLVWFHFNDKFALWILRPVATGYEFVLPKFARTGIDTAFKNLRTPIPLVSCLLQGRWKDSAVVAERFAINSTAGVLGFVDVARRPFELVEVNEDTDQAFGAWGIPTGWYLIWPLCGPSSVRGTFGLAGDIALTPYTWIHPTRIVSPSASALYTVNKASFYPDQYKDFKDGAVKPYIALREAYYENRKKLVAE